MSGGKHDHPRSLEVVPAGAIERLWSQRAEIEEAIFVRICEEVVDRAGRDDAAEYVAGLRAAVAAVFDYGVRGIELGDGYSATVPSEAIEQARRAARAGVGLGTVLRRYVAGHALLDDFVIQECDHNDFLGQGIALCRALETSALLFDLLIPSITSAYTQELAQASHSRRESDHALLYDQPQGSIYPMGPATGGWSVVSHGSVVGTRRIRIIDAMVLVVCERGFANASVTSVCARAKVSRRTFYDQFDSREDCFRAVLDEGHRRIARQISSAFGREGNWSDGVRVALASLLRLFDTETEWARVLIIEVLAAGSWALEHRERHMVTLTTTITQYWVGAATFLSPTIVGEGVIDSVVGVVYRHLITRRSDPLITLLGPLMGLITALSQDTQRVFRETRRGARLAHAMGARDVQRVSMHDMSTNVGQGMAFPAMLCNPNARHARKCLLFLAERPESSNREVATGIGVAHQSQISRLLSSLIEEDLVVKCSEGAGKRNAWRLTQRGREVSRVLSKQGD